MRLSDEVKRRGLTRCERHVLVLLRKGLSNKEIASALNIGVRTAKWHISNVYRRFHVTDRISLHKVVGFSLD